MPLPSTAPFAPAPFSPYPACRATGVVATARKAGRGVCASGARALRRWPRWAWIGLIWMVLGSLAVAQPANAAVHRFSIPAGPAPQALEQFSRQAGEPAMFLTEMVEHVRTSPVEGEMTAMDALTRMFAGTGLVAAVDEPSGALVLHGAADASTVPPPAAPSGPRRSIPLPPFLVEESLGKRPWRYAGLPGLEVLSHCPDEVTTKVVAQYYRLHALLQLVLPRELQGRTDTPVSFILYDTDGQTALSRQLVGRLTAAVKRRDDGDFFAMPNFRLWDQDSLAIFFSLDLTPSNRYYLDHAELTLTSDYVHYLAAMRTPTLPGWFVAGLAELYRTVEVTAAPETPPAETGFGRRDEALAANRIQFGPFVWNTPAETERLAADPHQAPYLPLSRVFADPAADEAIELRAARMAEAALFIRWALDPGKPESRRPLPANLHALPSAAMHPEALWQFVARLAAGAAAAEAFRDSFGIDLRAMDGHLRYYQREVLASPDRFRLHLEHLDRPPTLNLREATPGEIGRIKGRLERLNVAYVRTVYPELVGAYLDQARSTFQRAREAAPDDVQVLAEAGLCEADAGNIEEAQRGLTAAARAGVIHPRVYVELARIELQRATPAAGHKLAPAATRDVLAWLDRADAQQPALRESFVLRARTLMQSAGPGEPRQWAALDRGLGDYPRDPELQYAVALALAMTGHVQAARDGLERALQVIVDPAAVARFRRLQQALPAGSPAEEVKP